jgi:hypothetical protein
LYGDALSNFFPHGLFSFTFFEYGPDWSRC